MGKQSKPRLLVTGGSGYLGRCLVRLAAPAWQVTATYFSHPPQQAGADWRPLDLRDQAAVQRLVDEVAPAAIVHTAAVNPGAAGDMLAVNEAGSRHVASAARVGGARLLHLSTDVIFDGHKGHYVEDDPPTPITSYGRSKALAEEAVQAAGAAALIVRTSLTYGWRPQLDRHTRWVVDGLRAGQPVRLFTDELRCPIWVESLAAALLELAAGDTEGVLHVAGAQDLSRYEFGWRLARFHGLDPQPLIAARSGESGLVRPLDCTLDSSRARALLTTPLPGVDQVLEWEYSMTVFPGMPGKGKFGRIRAEDGFQEQYMEDEVRILVIDDNRPLREFVVQALGGRQGFATLQARDGLEGLEMALTHSPDLILMDYEMPRMNGLEVLKGLRARQVDIPVILMTSHGSEAIAVEVFRQGVRDYLMKPFAADEMFDAVERALIEVRLRQEKEALTRRLAAANQQLRGRVRELDTLYQIGKSITSLLSRDQLLDRILDAAFYVIGAEEVSLMLLDEETGRLRLERQRQRVPGDLHQVGRRSIEELASDAAEKGQATATGAMLFSPLKVGERVVGALGVSNRVTARALSGDDKRLLMALADYAAIALENARLLRTVEETKEREKQIVRGMFERYVAPTVVERLLAQPDMAALGGTRQTVAVLFADIRGFSTYSALTDPETLVETLNCHLAVAADAVLAEEGTLDKFMGDAVMAFFNAPLPQPDFLLRAARAALRLHHAVSKVNQGIPTEHRLEFGVGISVGEAVVGNIGTAQMMSFTVIGDAVNLGRRLQEHAHRGQTLLSQHAYELIHQQIVARPVGALEIKGREQPEPAYELLGLKRQS